MIKEWINDKRKIVYTNKLNMDVLSADRDGRTNITADNNFFGQ